MGKMMSLNKDLITNKKLIAIFIISLVSIASYVMMAKLPEDHVNAIFIDEYGREWFGTDKGLVVKTENSFQAFYTNPDEPGVVTDIKMQKSTDGDILWVSTTNGLCRINCTAEAILSSTFMGKEKTGFGSEEINALDFDSLNTGFFSTSAEVGILADYEWQNITEFPDIYENCFTSVGIKGDTVYLGTKGEGVARLVKDVDGYSGASRLVRPWSSLPSDNVTCVFVDSKGNRWYGTEKGVSLHTKNDAKQGWDFSLSYQLPDEFVTCLTEDKSGNIWVGTKDGLVVVSPSLKISTIYSTEDGLPSNEINSLAVGLDGSIWVGTDSGAGNIKEGEISSLKMSDYINDYKKL